MKNFLSLDISYTYCSMSLYTLKNKILINKLCFYKKNISTNNVLFFLFLKSILNKTQIDLSEINYISCGTTIGDRTNIKKIKCICKGISCIFNIPILLLSKLKALALGAWFDYNYSYIISCIKISKTLYYIGIFHFVNKGQFFHIPTSLIKERKITIKNPLFYSAHRHIFTLNQFLYTGKGFLYINRDLCFKPTFFDPERIPDSIYHLRLSFYFF
ncbi:peptidase [Candidatus Portiera aleyrodidarum]|uniref:peptidase n=1 Tax=Candidatus Portiera aleyrodidarum TaxID=91844 RepID=UPI000C78FA14|nr:peptidase [Candidatus Portiera aleyrodidarum]AUI73272.1 peptidase [Candidatus Portiera aleyrodidarum]